jgi:hypothetical protein
MLAGNASERQYGSPATTGKCNKISIQIYKVIQHFTGRTWKKRLVIIVGWQRIGKAIWVTCNNWKMQQD